jgi:hypothetical protein
MQTPKGLAGITLVDASGVLTVLVTIRVLGDGALADGGSVAVHVYIESYSYSVLLPGTVGVTPKGLTLQSSTVVVVLM